MTEPGDMPRESQPELVTHPEPRVTPEVIKDLDVVGGDTDDIVGGCSWTHQTGSPD